MVEIGDEEEEEEDEDDELGEVEVVGDGVVVARSEQTGFVVVVAVNRLVLQDVKLLIKEEVLAVVF